MDPVVICSTLQWFSRVDGLIKLLLFLPKVIGDLQSVLSFDSITFALFFGLLLVGDLWGLHKILLGMFHWAEHAFVLLVSLLALEKKVEINL